MRSEETPTIFSYFKVTHLSLQEIPSSTSGGTEGQIMEYFLLLNISLAEMNFKFFPNIPKPQLSFDKCRFIVKYFTMNLHGIFCYWQTKVKYKKSQIWNVACSSMWHNAPALILHTICQCHDIQVLYILPVRHCKENTSWWLYNLDVGGSGWALYF